LNKKGPIELIRELSRRRVIRSVGAYIGAVWVVSLGAAELFPTFGLPDGSVRALVLIGLAGIPLVALLSWKFDLTRGGLIRDSRRDTGESPVPRSGAVPPRTTVTRHRGDFVTVSWTRRDGVRAKRDFSNNFTIGRDPDVDLQLDDARVSRRHLEIRLENGRWKVHDLHSSNGTYLNGSPVIELELPDSCRLRLDRHGPELSIDVHRQGDTTVRRPFRRRA
jgi:hypothetical protein